MSKKWSKVRKCLKSEEFGDVKKCVKEIMRGIDVKIIVKMCKIDGQNLV